MKGGVLKRREGHSRAADRGDIPLGSDVWRTLRAQHLPLADAPSGRFYGGNKSGTAESISPLSLDLIFDRGDIGFFICENHLGKIKSYKYNNYSAAGSLFAAN